MGRVWHARLKPFAHAFRYRAFYLQLPLKSLAQTMDSKGRVGGWGWGINRPALLSVNDRDHGDGRPLLQWAKAMLEQAGVHDVDGEIWLQTFPRMLGYVFKPVSFWFCERADGQLRAVIAEVNNTFGDRYVYVLNPAQQPIRNGQTLTAEKAFYVSPFFEVRGRYQFRFFKSGLGGHDLARIEYQDESGALLLTSMSGDSQALCTRSAILAWLRYPVFSIGVITRIHWQALLLWLKGAKFISKADSQHPSPLN
ncbi:DUF1365 domain-containing protein [beta proteobacterium MWH-UniP1]